jgi:hypothetical protein
MVLFAPSLENTPDGNDTAASFSMTQNFKTKINLKSLQTDQMHRYET